jgi:serine/threonine protein kinase/Tol biopolymer transport system component
VIGQTLGHYRVLQKIGAGGMGEVYRARDERLGRDVAIKVLPASFSSDPDRLRRFEQEARATAALNHANIMAIYDVGVHHGSPYVVSELLLGETLRQRLRQGALPQRKAIEFATQAARGIAAAHEKGIIHRDLKPENIFITNDGQVKILDFGLAKLVSADEAATAVTAHSDSNEETQPGVVMGTVGYMSPEQVRGLPADHRADIFSLGAVLYEMLSGRRAFKSNSAAETMTAILKEDPPQLSETHPHLSPTIDPVVRHCLEKKPEERFHSARDLAFNLESLSDISHLGTTRTTTLESHPTKQKSRVPIVAASVVLATAVFAGGLALGKRGSVAPPASFHMLTFRRGNIRSARFAPDGETIVYSAAWDGDPVEVFAARPESPESRALGLAGSEILAISPAGQMAISMGSRQAGPWTTRGTLAMVSLAGGTPREMLENVQWADWAPKNNNLVVVREVNGQIRLEFPIDKVLVQTDGWLSHPRISPQGDQIAFLEHPLQGDDGGSVALTDLAGKKKTLSNGWLTLEGLAWTPKGEEIWFTGTKSGSARALYAVTPAGKERVVLRVPGSLSLHDIRYDGSVLLARDNLRIGMNGFAPGDFGDRDLSWFDASTPFDLTPDGQTVMFSESGEGGGNSYGIYLRQTDGSPAVQLGSGLPLGLSPDKKWVLSVDASSPTRITLLPTKAGVAKKLNDFGFSYIRARWLPDGEGFVFEGNEPGQGAKLYVQDIDGGKPQAISSDAIKLPSVLGYPVSPDGQLIAAIGGDDKGYIYPIRGGPRRSIPGFSEGDQPVSWSTDSRSLLVYHFGELPTKIYRLDLDTAQKTLWKQLVPSDHTGVVLVGPVLVTPNAKSYVYGYIRIISDLYLVQGLK